MDFEPFPKIPRLNRDIVVTEKIDGTNAAVLVQPGMIGESAPEGMIDVFVDTNAGTDWFWVGAQSRKRAIVPNEVSKGADNAGFAAWVWENATTLARLLGPGRHYGEWWGKGIQGRYPSVERRFWLFNPRFHFHADPRVEPLLVDRTLGTVPVLYAGPFDQAIIDRTVDKLRDEGSVAAPGESAEGVIIFHEAARQLFKVTCHDDEKPKEVVAREIAKVAANGGGKVNF